jgi:hypothetical protein
VPVVEVECAVPSTAQDMDLAELAELVDKLEKRGQ